MAMELGEHEQNVISVLVRLFKNQGEALLCDEGKLTLPASALVVVNQAFEIIRSNDDFESSFEATPANTSKLPHLHHVQMLYDFVQKLRRLKVLHHNETLPGSINVSSFRALRHLELHRLPLHLVYGLAKICNQLETMACTKCCSSLQDLFEHCGGDKSSPLSWSNLQAIYLRSNAIQSLDTSLRLVPMVTVLDLSHNSINDTMNYLECLSELSMLNLNFNKIYKVPLFSLSCKARIQVLLLRYNRLSHIDGIEQLTNLCELDIRGNLIASHGLLIPLKTLSKLRKIQLNENPLCYHRNHRVLTVQNIHPMAVKQVFLDDKPFTKKELKFTDSSVPTSYVRQKRYHLNGLDSNTTTDFEQSIERGFGQSYDASYSATTPSEPDIKATSLKISTKKKKGSRKGKSLKRARKADISDMDSQTQETMSVDSFKVSSYIDDDSSGLRDHLETMRNQLGPDWLQTLEQQHKISAMNSGTSEVASQGSMSRKSNSPAFVTTAIPEESPQRPSSEREVAVENYPDEGLNYTAAGNDLTDSQTLQQQLSHEKPPKQTPDPVTMIWKSTGSESYIADYGPESEPFIVSSIDDPDESYLVTVSERYVLEKDINGVVIEQLDLKSLLDASVYEDSINTDGNTTIVHCVKLMFNYVNRSKRERRLVMEDDTDAQSLCELLRPTVVSNQHEAKAKDRLQCLKCNKEFSKQTAKRHVRKSSFGGMTKSSSIGQNMEYVAPLLVEKGILEEALRCPMCNSDMVIELQTNKTNTKETGQTSTTTPYGSLKMAIPLATSSAQTTPRKNVTAGGIGIGIPGVTSGSYKSCTSDLSTSYRSIKDAVLQANLTKLPVLQPDHLNPTDVSDIYVEEGYDVSMAIEEVDGKSNDESFKSLVIGDDKTSSIKRNDSHNNVLHLNGQQQLQRSGIVDNLSNSSSATVKNTGIYNHNNDVPYTQDNVRKSYLQTESNGASRSKITDTEAWVEHSSEGLAVMPIKSNSSTGIINRVSESDLERPHGSRSNTDSRGVHSNMYLSHVSEVETEMEFGTKAFHWNNSSDVRPSGSDIVVLENPSKTNAQNESETNYREGHSGLQRSGSDLVVLKNPSDDIITLETADGKIAQNESETIKNTQNLISPFYGAVSMCGQLTRIPGKGSLSHQHHTDHVDNIELSVSDLDDSQGVTNSDSFFSAMSSQKKTAAVDVTVEEEELDETNPFYEGSKSNTTSNPIKGHPGVTSELNRGQATNIHHQKYHDSKKSKDNHSNHSVLGKDKLGNELVVNKHKHSEEYVTNENQAVSPSVNHTSLHIRRQSSDIEVLTEESNSPDAGNNKTSQNESHGNIQRNDELSPVGSLTNRAVNDMVDFMRSSIYDSSINSDDLQDLSRLTIENSAVSRDRVPGRLKEELISYDCDDFSKIDHRLKLHLMMKVFTGEEEFHLLLKCGVLHYTKSEEFPALLVASNQKLYIFKVVSKENPDNIDKWLKLTHSQALTELQYLDIGLGYQSFRFELGHEATCFDFLIRDELRCKTFIAQFTALLQGTSFSSRSQLKAITKNNPQSLLNLQNQVIMYATDVEPLDPVEVDVEVARFLKGYLHTSKKDHSPVSVVITNSHICLASENHKFPPPRCIAESGKDKGHVEVKSQQFSFKDRQRVTDLTRVVLGCDNPSSLTLFFMDDTSTDECKWLLSMATTQSLNSLVVTLKEVWIKHFGVDLQVDTMDDQLLS